MANECDLCGGSGSITDGPASDDPAKDGTTETCPSCGGSGEDGGYN